MDGRQRRELQAPSCRGSRRAAAAPPSSSLCGSAGAAPRGGGASHGSAEKARHAVLAGHSVQRKVRELRRLVPGGTEMPAEQLFLHTADYIHRLRLQVQVLRALSELCTP
ncbi:hypothetical protein Cni_G15276 [Canna indica]|uniref:BHLH domain-containing protein n=1 Tax=Canna indica TaxID=4628 RepID=A0AAQ3KHM7_9LILI|nr:hypothetical protein Cni_G15276 [Canna indica]